MRLLLLRGRRGGLEALPLLLLLLQGCQGGARVGAAASCALGSAGVAVGMTGAGGRSFEAGALWASWPDD